MKIKRKKEPKKKNKKCKTHPNRFELNNSINQK